MAKVKNSTNNKWWWGCRENGSLVHCGWECKLVQSLRKTAEFPQKTKNSTTIWPRNSSPGYIFNKKKTLIWKYTCTPMFIEALFTITKIWKLPHCPSTKKWIKMMWYTHTHMHTHTHAHMHNGILLRHKKIKSADGIMLSEVSQIEKCYIISLMKNLKIK